ncbi:MAG: MFS transporter [Candidatus Melainabacteria bacterium]|jgi:fucose permease|nr:MFS transporter [Candidatus Melainabacteria bacterium]
MKNKEKQNQGFLALMAAVAFAYLSFGAITNVAGAIIPKIRDTYSVSASLSAFLAATFFIAYGITSIPWGVFMEKNSKKTTLVSSSLITTAGVLLFAAVPGFYPNMFAMFLCGVGITGVQVALNPLVAEISDPAKYSRNLTMFMVINGAGSYAAPQLVTLIKTQGLHWSVTYWVFTALALIMTLAVAFPKYPAAETNDQDLEAKALSSSELSGQSVAKARSEELKMRKDGSESKNLTLELLTSNPIIYLYALGIFLYVGVEVGVANTIGFYLQDKLQINDVLGAAAEAAQNTAISNYWLGLLAGRFVGTAVLDKIPGKLAIKIYIGLAAAALYMAMTGDINQALLAFPAIGFFISIMFPTIYSLATNSFGKEYSSAISGILCTAIIGGAVIGPVMAWVAEANQGTELVPNWDAGLLVAFACYAYIFVLGMFAKEEK